MRVKGNYFVELVLVSYHPERVRELKRILQDSFPEVHFSSPADFPAYTQITEERGSLEEQATKRALDAAKILSKPCLADISGLIIPSLGKENVFCEEKHQSGLFLPDTKKILRDLINSDESRREAFLECALSFATPQHGLVRSVTCRIEGFIASQAKGSSTFDFASVFIKHEYNKTLAQLSPSVQSRISHRRKACEKLLPFLRSYFLKKPS